MLPLKGRKRQSEQSAEVTERAFLSWTQRQTYPTSSLSAQKPQKRKSSSFTLKFTSNRNRLPGSPTGEPELMEDVVYSFEGHQGQKEGRTSGATARPQSDNAWPSKSRVSGKREASIEQSLGTMREAHQKVLAMGAALKGEIEMLSHPISQRQLEVRARSKSKDHQMHGSMECKRR